MGPVAWIKKGFANYIEAMSRGAQELNEFGLADLGPTGARAEADPERQSYKEINYWSNPY